MKRRLLRIAGLIGLLFLLGALTGCWSRKELNTIAIVVALGLDANGSETFVSMQVVNPTEIASKNVGQGAGTPVTLFGGKGATVLESIRRMTTVLPRRSYMSHLRVLVIGEELAREGLNQVLDIISRNYQLRSDFYIVVAKEAEAHQVLKVLTPIERIPANKLYGTLELAQKEWAPTAKVRLDELINNLTTAGKDSVLTGIRVMDGSAEAQSKINIQQVEPPTKLVYSGLAVFKKDKLVGWLTESESKGYSYIINKVKSTVGSLPCPDGTGLIDFDIVRSKAAIKGAIVNGKPRIRLNISLEQDVGEVRCRKLDLTSPDTIAELEKVGAEKLREIVEQSVRKAQSLHADIFGFGQAIHRADPRAWKKLQPDWDELFRSVPVDLQAQVKIRRLGTVIGSYTQAEKE